MNEQTKGGKSRHKRRGPNKGKPALADGGETGGSKSAQKPAPAAAAILSSQVTGEAEQNRNAVPRTDQQQNATVITNHSTRLSSTGKMCTSDGDGASRVSMSSDARFQKEEQEKVTSPVRERPLSTSLPTSLPVAVKTKKPKGTVMSISPQGLLSSAAAPVGLNVGSVASTAEEAKNQVLTGRGKSKTNVAIEQATTHENASENSTSNTPVDPATPAADLRRVQESKTADTLQKSEVNDNEGKTQGEATKKSVEKGSAPGEKSKAELRAERRALQEAQRAAKAAKKGDVKAPSKAAVLPAGDLKSPAPATRQKKPDSMSSEKAGEGGDVRPTELETQTSNLVTLFSHLPQFNKKQISVIRAANDGIHPMIVRLGLQISEGVVCGSNARCVALVHALKEVVRDFRTPVSKEFSDALYSLHIEPSINFLEKCRPISVGMRNLSKKLREEIADLKKDLPEDEARKYLEGVLDSFLEDDIKKAHQAIIDLAKQKISRDDVILTYGCSYVVKKTLIAAHETEKFRVIVVDARPKLEGKNMLRYLTEHGIKCTYVLINAVTSVMKEVTKVILGAHALLANGYVMSRVGSSQVALVAKAFNKPVLVCCETYKFCEVVQTDSVVYNELGNPDDLVDTGRQTTPLAGWRDIQSLNLLNLYYDVTPPDLVSVVINEVCLVPCTSVPVLLRVRPTVK